jgi:uncharacterized protein YecE (DUF72 family)
MRRPRAAALREIKWGAQAGSTTSRMPGRGFIGTSDWNYAAWREDFYGGRPAKTWLAFCAAGLGGKLAVVLWQLPHNALRLLAPLEPRGA